MTEEEYEQLSQKIQTTGDTIIRWMIYISFGACTLAVLTTWILKQLKSS